MHRERRFVELGGRSSHAQTQVPWDLYTLPSPHGSLTSCEQILRLQIRESPRGKRLEKSILRRIASTSPKWPTGADIADGLPPVSNEKILSQNDRLPLSFLLRQVVVEAEHIAVHTLLYSAKNAGP